jgi:hypothetical protein
MWIIPYSHKFEQYVWRFVVRMSKSLECTLNISIKMFNYSKDFCSMEKKTKIKICERLFSLVNDSRIIWPRNKIIDKNVMFVLIKRFFISEIFVRRRKKW